MRAARASALGWWTVRALLAAVIGAVCAAPMAAPAEGAGSATVLGVRLGGDDNQTRIVIDVDRAVSASLRAAESGPRRIVLDLPAVDPATSLEAGGQGLIKAWRVQGGGDGARLVLDLAGEGQIAHRFLLAPRDGVTGYRYVVDVARIAAVALEDTSFAGPIPPMHADTSLVARVSSPQFPPAGKSAQDARAPRTPRQASPKLARLGAMPDETWEGEGVSARVQTVASHGRSRYANARPPAPRRAPKVVVIDAGHGGHDPGAQSSDANEKDITLAAARVLKARLERDGRYKVVMTRDGDVFIPLEDRVRIARRAGADLFISLHADSAGADPDTHGASVYTLSDRGETRVTQVLGDHEWFTRSGGHAADPAVGQILLDLTQRSTLNRSALFAGLLIDRLGDTIDLLPRSHRDAGYFVLLAPDVPAVLLEMGFISSQIDEARLTDPARRDTLMDAVGDAIDGYFTGQTTLAAR